jgi:hypothetical protein
VGDELGLVVAALIGWRVGGLVGLLDGAVDGNDVEVVASVGDPPGVIDGGSQLDQTIHLDSSMKNP